MGLILKTKEELHLTVFVRILYRIITLWYNPDMIADMAKENYTFPLPKSKYEEFAQKLYSPLKLGENSVMMCPPLYGKDHNVNYIWAFKKNRKKILGAFEKRFLFGHIQLNNPKVNHERIWLDQSEKALNIFEKSLTNFDKFSKRIKKLVVGGVEPVLFINVPETLSDDSFSYFLELAQKIYYIAPSRIHFLLIFDMKWEEEVFFELTAPFRSLFQNTVQTPLYSDSETLHFLKHFCQKWNLNLSKKAISYLVNQAGGIFLFAKAALRIVAKKKVKKLPEIENICKSHPEYILQLKFFYYRLTKKQREILKKVANFKKVDDESEIKHLLKMRILEKKDYGLTIRSNSLLQYLQDESNKLKRLEKTIQSSQDFSAREKRILRKFLEKPSMCLVRDKIAGILWGRNEHEKFSEWAIDQAMSRLRKKLKADSRLKDCQIITRKKQGFIFKP